MDLPALREVPSSRTAIGLRMSSYGVSENGDGPPDPGRSASERNAWRVNTRRPSAVVRASLHTRDRCSDRCPGRHAGSTFDKGDRQHRADRLDSTPDVIQRSSWSCLTFPEGFLGVADAGDHRARSGFLARPPLDRGANPTARGEHFPRDHDERNRVVHPDCSLLIVAQTVLGSISSIAVVVPVFLPLVVRCTSIRSFRREGATA